jgi:hypothetical protein
MLMWIARDVLFSNGDAMFSMSLKGVGLQPLQRVLSCAMGVLSFKK